MKVGDWLTFKTAYRYGDRKARRKVVGFTRFSHLPQVRYAGYADFIVLPTEIISVDGEK